jgi:hypothetical protein
VMRSSRAKTTPKMADRWIASTGMLAVALRVRFNERWCGDGDEG